MPPYYFPDFLSADFAATSSTTAFEAVLIAGALVVARWYGYRLARSLPAAGDAAGLHTFR